MKSKTTKRFCELLDALPESVQRQAHEACRLFRQNPSHPSLPSKPIGVNDPMI